MDGAAPAAAATATPAANVKYVDQYGNPVAPPTANVKYVDQYGNPVAPPVVGGVAAVPTVKYVDQFGNPIAPTVAGGIITRPAIDYRARNTQQQRIASTVFGCLGVFFMVIGFCVDNLARDDDYWYGNDYLFTCRFTKFDKECDDYYYSSCYDEEYSWSELCDSYDYIQSQSSYNSY